MKRSILAALLAISALSVVALPGVASAHGRDEARSAEWAKKFPMPAAEFKQHSEARLAKVRARVEEKIGKLPADKAKEVRAKFAENETKIRAEVDRVAADGTVTLDEAKGVKALARSLRPKHGKR